MKSLKYVFIFMCLLSGFAGRNLNAAGITVMRQMAGLEVASGDSIIILTDYLEIEGSVHPEDLSILILTGDHYTFAGDTVITEKNFSGELTVNIQVRENELVSNVFQFLVIVMDGGRKIEFINGDFEQGDEGKWSSRNGLITTIVSKDSVPDQVFHGNYALKIEYDGNGYLRTAGTTYFPVSEGKEYEMVFYAKSLNTGSGISAAMTSGSNEAVNDYEENFVLTSEWTRYSYRLISPITGTFGCRFHFSNSDSYWLDRIYLVEIATISPPRYFTNIYVSGITGSDTNSGSLESPLKTVHAALEHVGEGGRIVLREGHYHEENIIQVTSPRSAPLVVSSYPGENAVLDGTVLVHANWTRHEGNIWKTKITNTEVLKHGAHQVWIDGKMMKVARWPNYKGTFADDFNFDYTARNPEPGTNWDMSTAFVSLENDFSQVSEDADTAVWKSEGTGNQSLAATGIDFTGAMVALKMGYETVLEEIVSHKAGEEVFVSSSTEGSNRNELLTLGKQYYFILADLDCLDSEGEWYYDASTNYLYLYTAYGESLANKELRMKTQLLAFQINNSENVILDGLNFYGIHFSVADSRNIEIKNCVLEYPSYFPAMLKTRTLHYSPHVMTNSSVRVYNCELRYFDGPGLYFDGSNTFTPVLENTLLHNSRFNHMVNFFKCRGAYAVHNTLYVSERGNGIKYFKSPYGHFVAEYNYMHDLATHRSDASCIQVQSGSQNYDTLRYNWFHDTENKGIRFDGEPAGKLGTMYANVGWDMWQGLQVKGDSQNVVNNTFFNCAKRCDITVLAAEDFGGNEGSQTYNNAAERLSGHRVRTIFDYPLPGKSGNNWNGFITGKDITEVIRDPENLDFRPQEGSVLIDGGINLAPFVRKWNGASRDIGAYESSDSIYWIPGRKEKRASMPVPPDGTISAHSDCDLMWLEALGTLRHRVYFGTSENNLQLVSEQQTNIYHPENLNPSQVYYWRIDEVMDDSISMGKIWCFVPYGGKKQGLEFPVTYFENFNQSDDDANHIPWNDNIWEPEYLEEDSSWVVNDSLKIWPSANRTSYGNFFRLKNIDMILRPHPLMKFSYRVPEEMDNIVVAVNVTSEDLQGTPIKFKVPITTGKGRVLLQIGSVFEAWDAANPGKKWDHLQDFDIWFFPENDFSGSEEITIDDFKLGFGILLDESFQIEITGQDTIITEPGNHFFMSVDKLQLELISSEFPGAHFPVVDPYALPAYPRIEIEDSEGYDQSLNIITPYEVGYNPILMPVRVISGEIASNQYLFKIYLHEFVGIKDEPVSKVISVYPNPFSNVFFISDVENIKEIHVYNTEGRPIIICPPGDGPVQLDGYPDGLYIIEVLLQDGGRQYFKVIKQQAL